MKDARFVVGENIVPLIAPVDKSTNSWASPFVDLKNALHATFFVYFGVITSTSADEYITITMEVATTSASGAEVAIPFRYRLSGATGANTWGAITSVAATGVAILTASNDGMLLAIDIDPAALDTLLALGRHVRMVGTSTEMTVDLMAAWAVLDPRYPQLTQQSAT
jgi:hypothetical protein